MRARVGEVFRNPRSTSSSWTGAENPRLTDGNGRSAMPVEFERRDRLAQHQHVAFDFAAAAGSRADRPRPDRPGRRRAGSPSVPGPAAPASAAPPVAFQRVALIRLIVAAIDNHLRRTGLVVPAHELRKIKATDVGEALDKLLDGGASPSWREK